MKALQEGKSVGIASGFKPSGAYHFGHGLTSATVKFFQQNGAQIFMPVADIEARLGGILEDDYTYYAADNLLDWGAMGVNLDASHVYLQSEEFRGFSLVPYIIGTKKAGLSFNLPVDIYGMKKINENFPFIVSGITQVSDIILPQHNDFGNHHSFMVSGQDQDGHMRMTSELTERALKQGDIKRLGVQTVPSGVYIPHIRGISGDKASSSKPESTLYLGSGPQQEDLDERIKSTIRKFDNADSYHVKRCVLDMVRFIDIFNRENSVDFRAIVEETKYKDLVRIRDDKKENGILLEMDTEELNYYPTKMREFGAKPIQRFVQYHPNPSRLMQKGITFAHKDLESIVDAMANNKPWAVVSGLNPSGPLHFGHKQVFEELLWLQDQGAEIFIPITNDESYVVGKAKSLAESRRIAYELVIPSIIAMGFRPENTHIFVDSDYPDLYNVAMDVSRYLSLKKVMGVFGFGKDEEGENPGTLFYRGGVQLAQILLPQYAEFGGLKPTLIPVGIDQNPYIQLAREVAREKGMIPPGAIFTKFGLGLDGKGKMSSSRLESAVFLTDDLKIAEKKLKTAYTGGSAIASFQREHGGIPEICPIGLLRTYHFEEDNSVTEKCAGGEILCGECKKEGIVQVLGYLEAHQAKLPEARKRIDEYLLKTPIRSIFK